MALSVPLEVVDGHLVAEAGGRFLLDTGSPMSFARTGQVVWAGRDHELATNLLGLDSPELSDLVGTPLDGLLGGDVLGESPFTVDLERGACFFDETPTDRDGIELQLRLVLGVPFTSLEFDGLPTATCIDTGAKLSYLERGRLAGTEVVGEADDFYPGLGAFRTAHPRGTGADRHFHADASDRRAPGRTRRPALDARSRSHPRNRDPRSLPDDHLRLPGFAGAALPTQLKPVPPAVRPGRPFCSS